MPYREIEIPIRFSSTSYTLHHEVYVSSSSSNLHGWAWLLLSFVSWPTDTTSRAHRIPQVFLLLFSCLHMRSDPSVDIVSSRFDLFTARSLFLFCPLTKNSLTFNLKPTPIPSVGCRHRPTVTKIYIQHTIECIQWQHTHFTRKINSIFQIDSLLKLNLTQGSRRRLVSFFSNLFLYSFFLLQNIFHDSLTRY